MYVNQIMYIYIQTKDTHEPQYGMVALPGVKREKEVVGIKEKGKKGISQGKQEM